MNGVVVVDKPAGLTSHDVVTMVKRALEVRKAGHVGTLDPLATGVLVVCLDEGTKLSPFLSGQAKTYRATMLLGVETDTLDIEGRVVRTAEARVREEEVRQVLARFRGRISQRPPLYSAVKHRGRALYSWARKGVAVEAPPREVEIFSLEVEEVKPPHVTFSVTCSAGTYVRSLCAEAGGMLGCGACLYALRRTASGPFDETRAVRPEDREALRAGVIPMAEALSHVPSLYLDEGAAEGIRRGIAPRAEILGDRDHPLFAEGDMVKFLTPTGHLAAVAALEGRGGADGRTPGACGFRLLRVFKDP